MYICDTRLCVCLSLTAFPHYCTDLDISWGNGRGFPLVVQYWVDLQSVHGFHCHDNIALNEKCQQVLCTRSVPGYHYETQFVSPQYTKSCHIVYMVDIRNMVTVNAHKLKSNEKKEIIKHTILTCSYTQQILFTLTFAFV